MIKKAIIIVLSVAMFCSCSNNKLSSSVQQSDNRKSVENANSKDEIVLVMAARFTPNYMVNGKNLIDVFNEEDNGYRIEIRDYGTEFAPEDASNEWENGDQEMCLDIMAGSVDIIPNTFEDQGKFISLAEKGAFADLDQFMESDPEINRSTLFDHILEISEIDGKLCFLPLSFKLKTLVGDSTYVGNKENWTIDELREHWEQMPEGSSFNHHRTKDYVYYTLLRGCLSSFIDYDNAVCRFDSEEFISILDFINTFDPPLSYKDEQNWSAPVFLTDVTISGFQSFHEVLYDSTNVEKTFVGYPSYNGSGTLIDTSEGQIAISALSSPEKQEGAWQFVRLLASYDYQMRITRPESYVDTDGAVVSFDDGEYFFPVNKQVFDTQANEYISRHGEKNIRYTAEGEYDIGYLSEDEYDRLIGLIDSSSTENVVIEGEMFKVIEDELFSMFFGEQNSQETADNIQNRLAIMVSERY